MLLINRQKRNLPSIPPEKLLSSRLQLRRANSESRFRLPAVPITSSQNLDDEHDLLEIDLNDPIGSMKRTLRSKTESELETLQDTVPLKVKQSRDQTTNTPPLISNPNASIKSKKNARRIVFDNQPPVAKLQKVGELEIGRNKRLDSSRVRVQKSSIHFRSPN